MCYLQEVHIVFVLEELLHLRLSLLQLRAPLLQMDPDPLGLVASLLLLSLQDLGHLPLCSLHHGLELGKLVLNHLSHLSHRMLQNSALFIRLDHFNHTHNMTKK